MLMKKTILFFSGYFLPAIGGIEQYTYQLSKQLIKRGYHVVVVSSQYKSNLRNEEEIDGIKVYRLPAWDAKKRYPILLKNRLYRNLLNKICEERADIYVCQTRFQTLSLLGAKLAVRSGQVPIVIEHGTAYLTVGNKLMDLFLNKIERLLTKKIKRYRPFFYGVSQGAADWLEEFNLTASGVLYNAINSSEFQEHHHEERPEKDKICLVYVGRLIPKVKGIEMLCSAFVEISQGFPEIELVIVGEGPLKKSLIQKYHQYNVIFTGELSHEEVLTLLNATDVFVLLSESEGFSTSLLEAAMMENIIITTKVGSSYEILVDKTYGYVIEKDRAALIETLNNITVNFDTSHLMKKKVSRRVMAHFDWESTADKFENIISRLS